MKAIEQNGYKISGMTLGTVQLGLSYGINNNHGMPTFEESANILHKALELGIVSFDTARAYGKSEEFLGKFFKGNDAKKTIITKAVFTDETKENVKESLFKQVQTSLKNLNLTKLPFLMLHHGEDLQVYGKTLLDACIELQKEGLVDNIGASFSEKDKIEPLYDPTIFNCIQLAQNMFDNKEIKSGLLKKLEQSGTTVFVRSVYLQGLFFKDVNSLPEKLKSAAPALNKLHKLAEENNMSMSRLALSFMRGIEGISSLVLGCETPEQLSDSAHLFTAPTLSKAVTDAIFEISEEVPPVVTDPRQWNQ